MYSVCTHEWALCVCADPEGNLSWLAAFEVEPAGYAVCLRTFTPEFPKITPEVCVCARLRTCVCVCVCVRAHARDCVCLRTFTWNSPRPRLRCVCVCVCLCLWLVADTCNCVHVARWLCGALVHVDPGVTPGVCALVSVVCVREGERDSVCL